MRLQDDSIRTILGYGATMDVIPEIPRDMSSMMGKRPKLYLGACDGIANDSLVLLIKDVYELGCDE